jgi:Universal stress protein family
MNLFAADFTAVHAAVALVLGLAVGALVALRVRRRRAEPVREVRAILLPFAGGTISRRALDAAIRLARAEHARLVPAYLATVPLRMSIDAPLMHQCEGALPLLDVIEQRALRHEVEVDSRIERGRSPRDALQRLLAEECFERVVIPASSHGEAGFAPGDVAWILEHVDTEVLVFRAAPRDEEVLAGVAA